MVAVANAASLPPARRRLVSLMQDMNFGAIEGLTVRDGQPVFAPPPTVVRQIKLGSDSGPRPESRLNDFALKREVTELFSHFDRIGAGTIRTLEVRHGLPFSMKLEEPAA